MQVSVVIPTFNRGPAIQTTIDSVFAQTVAPLEIIVVDDGSTDGTPEWVEAHYGDAVRVVRQRNGGVARARNRGWREARGEWIAFLDHDDVFHPDKLERLAPLANSEVGVIVSRWSEVENGVVQQESPVVETRNVFAWLLGWSNPIASMSIPLVRRELLERVGGFDPRAVPADDWDLWLRLARQTQFAFCDEVLTDYTLHPHQQRLDERRMFRAARHVLSKYPVELGRRPLLLWWLLFSGAFVPSIGAYKRFKNGETEAVIEAWRTHPMALLSPQWVAALLGKLKGCILP